MLSNLKSVCNLFCYSSTTLAIIDNNPKTKKTNTSPEANVQGKEKKKNGKKKKDGMQTGRKIQQQPHAPK